MTGVPVFAAVLALFLVLGVFETFSPRKMDTLVSRVSILRGASERFRVRGIRLNGLLLLGLCVLMFFFALLGRL